jgi:putative ABC transport system permease protein
MFRNHLKTAFRNLWKKKGFSFLNLLGLALGIVAFLLILQFVTFELSYDGFHENKDDIYRVQLDQYRNGELIFASSENYPGVGPVLTRDLPEVLSYTRLYNLGSKNNMVVTWDDAPGEPISFKQRKLLYADSSFLTFFSYPILEGDPVTALSQPFNMVITESTAKKYFGEESAIGKMLHMKDDDYNDELCKVTAVVADMPDNTHLKFDVLISYKTLYTRGDWAPGRYNTSWRRKDMYSYIQVAKGVDPSVLEQKFPAIVEANIPEDDRETREDILSLQPITDIHLYSDLTDEAEANGNGEVVYFMLLIGFLILLIAYVNYINLSTARSLERANEVGVRKVMGAYRGQLLVQFLMEAFIINLTALLLALVSVEVALPFFNQLTGQNLPPLGIWSASWFVPALLGLLVFGTLLSGLYPAFVLSSFRPVDVLSSKYGSVGKGVWLRKALVIVQFAASVGLIIGTMIVYQQTSYMLGQDLGFEPEQIMVIERPGVSERDRSLRSQQIDVFTEKLEKSPAILKSTRSSTLLGKKMRFKSGVRKYTDPSDQQITFTFSGIDFDFVDCLGMEVVAGRNFSEDYGTDVDTACLLTESAAKVLGYDTPEEAIGKTLTIEDFRWSPIVIGVLKDYHQESLRLTTDPTLFYPTLYGAEYYFAKFNTSQVQEAIAQAEESWTEAFPGNPFEFFFLDDYFNRQYQNESRFSGLITFFAILAIFVGCLGLFGLSAFTAQKRTKEIGIRKVLGATSSDILRLLSKDFLVLILIANVLAWPMIWWLMQNWLQGFANRIDISWTVFVAAAVLVVVTAMATVSFQALKAAATNPAESLRSE